MTDRSVVRSCKVHLPGGVRPADIVIESGKFVAITEHGSTSELSAVRDFGNLDVLPGLVDIHVHLNEPGRIEWEGFETGSAAARAGGVTTLIDMPLNSSPVTTSIGALEAKKKSTSGKLHVDVGFHAGLIPGNASSIDRLIESGVIAAKAFLCPSGIDEFPHCTEADLRIAMPILARVDAVLLVHAEVAHAVAPMSNPRHYPDYLASRPRSFERNAIEMMIRLSRDTSCKVHIVHLADADCLPMIAEARKEGLPITVETCPHYLCFDAESIDDGRTDFKCAPPIRDADNRERLWEGLRDGLIDMIVSDHSPSTTDLKQIESGRFDLAWGGISSLQLGLSVIHTEAIRRGFVIDDIVRWMSIAPAMRFGLTQGIVKGHPAHLAVFDAELEWIVDKNQLLHRNPLTPYHGRSLTGRVVETFVHGDTSDQPMGRIL